MIRPSMTSSVLQYSSGQDNSVTVQYRRMTENKTTLRASNVPAFSSWRRRRKLRKSALPSCPLTGTHLPFFGRAVHGTPGRGRRQPSPYRGTSTPTPAHLPPPTYAQYATNQSTKTTSHSSATPPHHTGPTNLAPP